MSYTVRFATKADIQKAVEFGYQFHSESSYRDMKFSFDNAFYSLEYMIDAEDFHVLVAECDGTIVGLYIFGVENPWTIEKVAMCVIFYIDPQHRGKACACALLDKAEEICNNDDIALFYTSSTAGFDDGGVNERAFTGLMQRYGFKNVGSYLIKEYSNGKD